MDKNEQHMAAQAIEGKEQIWTCKIGGRVTGLPKGADGPMRVAVQACFEKLTGYEAEFTFSGWGAELTEGERAVVENREPRYDRKKSFEESIRHAINCHSMENASNTPDFILAKYLEACLDAFDVAVQQRETWYGRDARSSQIP